MSNADNLLGALSHVIRKRREEVGISQTELAERSKLHRTYINNIERGKQNISIESLNRIAEALDTSIGELINRAETESKPPTSPIKILLIEDNSADIFLFKRCLGKGILPTELTVVESGQEASELLKDLAKRQNDELPEIVFLDLNLPGKSGHELLKELKTDEMLRHIPVIILTTSSNPKDIQQTYTNYANSFLTKPVDPSDFEQAVNSVLSYWFDTTVLPGRTII